MAARCFHMARSICSTSPVMKNQFFCRPAACVKCDTHSKKGQKNPQISSERFSFRLFRPQCTCSCSCGCSRPSCFGTVFSKSLDHHSAVLVHLWFAVLFEEVCPITTLGWRVCGSVLLFEEVCPITTLGWRVCGSVLFFHSRLARLWFDLCPNGPVGRVASLPDATRPCAGQVQIGIFRACGRGRRVSDCLCF